MIMISVLVALVCWLWHSGLAVQRNCVSFSWLKGHNCCIDLDK